MVGAGDYIGSAIAKRFAPEGYTVLAGGETGTSSGLVAEIETAGGRCVARSLDARKEAEVAAFVAGPTRSRRWRPASSTSAPTCNFPIRETTERVFRKVWEMACYAGFLAGREAAGDAAARARLDPLHRRHGEPARRQRLRRLRGRQGGAARGGPGMARELGPRNIHVAHLVIDAGVDTAWVRERIGERGGADAALAQWSRTG